MSRPGARPPALLVLFAALTAAACGSRPSPGRPIESLELVDLTVPSMFAQVAQQLDEAYVVELPPVEITERHDLRLADTSERAVLDELCRLDPDFQHSMDGPALLLWPTGSAEETSPFSRRLALFRADGSVESVLRELIAAALPSDTVLVAEARGRARPVQLHLEDVSVREALAEIARQGHLMMTVEPGYVRVTALAE